MTRVMKCTVLNEKAESGETTLERKGRDKGGQKCRGGHWERSQIRTKCNDHILENTIIKLTILYTNINIKT